MTTENARETVIREFREGIAALDALTTNRDLILAWDYGLGVMWVGGKPIACGLQHAEVVATDVMPEEAWAFVPNVFNGRGDAAKVVRRGDAAKAEAEKLRALIDGLEVAAPAGAA